MGAVRKELHTVEGCLSHTAVVPNGCMIWRGSTRGQMGYAQFSAKVGTGSRSGHKEVYIWKHGSVPDGHDVGHDCDTPRCINPDHLIAQTRKDNIKQCVSRGRAVSNLDKSKHKPGTEEFSKRVAQGVCRYWSTASESQRRYHGQTISRGKRRGGK